MKAQIRLMQVFILLVLAFILASVSFATDETITLCHATGNATNPYVEVTITVPVNGLHGHEGHEDDISPIPLEGCPGVEATAEVTSEVTAEVTAEANGEASPGVGSFGGRITICHATGSATNPYVEITISVNGMNGHDGHEDDIIPMPEGGCPTGISQPNEPEATVVATAVASQEPMGNCEMPVYDGNFPIVEGDNCAPDTLVLERPLWQSISLAATICPDWLVYHSNETGDWELFRLGNQINDANPNLSRGLGAADIAPSRSPDGQWIAFMSNRDGNWEIYISAVETDFVQRVSYNTTAIERDPVWSPTGGQIVYESNRDGNWDLYLFDTSTGTEERVAGSDASDVNASWSQDGTRIVFQSDRDGGIWQIYEKTISSNDILLLSDGMGNDLAPQYIHDGSGIVFRSFREGSNSVIYWMNADGGNVQRISDSAGYALNHAVSPQGTYVAYTSNLDGDNDIYIYEFATGRSRQLTDNTVNDYAPTWYCGEPTVSFNSDITGNPDLFSASAIPMDAPAILVEEQANHLTNLASQELYPMRSPSEENASRTETFPAVMN